MKVIDFDWAAKKGEGFYPKDINMENVTAGEWHSEVTKGGEINEEHDKFALNALKEQVEPPREQMEPSKEEATPAVDV